MIIGLTGSNGAGKDTVARYIAKKGFSCCSLSDILRDELRQRSVPITRDNLIAMGAELRARHGQGVLARQILPALQGDTVVTSLRDLEEVHILRALGNFTLISVNAKPEIRYARSLARGKPGEGATLAQFLAKEARETGKASNSEQLKSVMQAADYKIQNNGNLDELYKLVDRLLVALGGHAK